MSKDTRREQDERKESKEGIKTTIEERYIEKYKDEFDECVQDFLSDLNSPNRKNIKTLVIELLLNIFIAREKIKLEDRIKIFIDNNLPQAFKNEPLKRAAFVRYFSQKIESLIFACIGQNLEEIKDIYIKCIGDMQGAKITYEGLVNIALGPVDGDIIMLSKHNSKKINVLLEGWKKELKEWAKNKDKKEPILKSIFKKTSLNFFALPHFINQIFLILASSSLAYQLLFQSGPAEPKDFIKPVFSSMLIFLVLGFYLIKQNRAVKDIQSMVKNGLISSLEEAVNLGWYQEAGVTKRRARKIAFKIRIQPPPRDPVLDAEPSKSIAKKLKGKGNISSVVVTEELSTSIDEEDEVSVEEEATIAGLYRLPRISHFGDNKEVYGYIPPETKMPDGVRSIFENILKGTKIVRSEGAQGIKFLSNKKLMDPGSALEYLALEIKRKDAYSSGDRLLGVAYPARRGDGKQCVILIFNTYDGEGRAEAIQLAHPLDESLPPGFSADKEKGSALSSDMPIDSNNSLLSSSSSPHSSADYASLLEYKKPKKGKNTDKKLQATTSFTVSSPKVTTSAEVAEAVTISNSAQLRGNRIAPGSGAVVGIGIAGIAAGLAEAPVAPEQTHQNSL